MPRKAGGDDDQSNAVWSVDARSTRIRGPHDARSIASRTLGSFRNSLGGGDQSAAQRRSTFEDASDYEDDYDEDGDADYADDVDGRTFRSYMQRFSCAFTVDDGADDDDGLDDDGDGPLGEWGTAPAQDDPTEAPTVIPRLEREKKKRKAKKMCLIFAVSFLSLCLVAGGSLAAWYFLNKSTKSDNASTASDAASSVQDSSTAPSTAAADTNSTSLPDGAIKQNATADSESVLDIPLADSLEKGVDLDMSQIKDKADDSDPVVNLLTTVSTLEDLQDEESPQYQAWQWLLKDKTLKGYLEFGSGSPEAILERYAMAVFYYSLGGDVEDGWTENAAWLSEIHVCSWFGVACDEEDLKDRPVTELRLVYNNLSGELPEEIAAISYLEKLDLSDNNIGGMLPLGFSDLTRLTDLRLGNNGIRGNLDINNFGSAGKMKTLLLENNLLQGPLPASIEKLRSLREFRLSGNRLTDEIPGEIGSLQSLDELDLSSNDLKGGIPPEIGSITQLKKLMLSGNELIGYLPESFVDLKELEEMHVDNNELEGPVPEWLGKLTSLRVLYMDQNSFHGPVPKEIIALKELEEFTLENNDIEGSIPEELCHLESMRIFSADCGGNPPKLGCSCCNTCFPLGGIDGELPEEDESEDDAATGEPDDGVTPFEDEYKVDTTDAPVRGGDGAGDSIELHTATLTLLAEVSPISVFRNKSSPQSQALEWLKGDSSLHAYLKDFPDDAGNHDNPDASSLFTEVMERYALATLYFSLGGGEELWVEDKDWLSEEHVCNWDGVFCEGEDSYVGRVKGLELISNELNGAIPDEIGVLTELHKIDFSNNYISGAFPNAGFGKLKNLVFLSLTNNQIQGEMKVDAMTELDSLEVLLVQGNALDGPIPKELGAIKSLRILRISENAFSGEIPAELGSLGELMDLDLGYNQLDGAIPEELGNLKDLGQLRLGSNKLTGEMPESLQNLEELEHLDVSSNELSGGIPDWIGNMKMLEVLALEGNKVAGDVPSSVCALSEVKLSKLSADCSGDSPLVTCACCDGC